MKPPETFQQQLHDMLDGARVHAAAYRRSGIRFFFRTPGTASADAAPACSKDKLLEAVRAELGDCRRCRLCGGRHHIVFGEGSPDARLLFVGEGPGADEDMQGRPFVGKAGLLLTRIINAIHLDRAEVYIANIVKCRPPGNRDPEEDEIQACLPFLKKQIAVIRPHVICALGRCAAQTLLASDQGISRLRGTFHRLEDMLVMPTYHPSYLLRNELKKKETWQDMQMVERELRRER